MSLFKESSTDADPSGQESQSQAPSAVDQLLQGIKNEKGEQKYSSVEEALRGASHAQEFIATLKREKEELAAMVKAQEQLEALLAKPPVAKESTPTQEAAPVKAGVSPEDVVAILKQQKEAEAAESNMDRVETSLKAAFGATYQETLNAKTRELGLTPALVDSMAKSSPDALLKLLDVKGKTAKPGFGSGQNTEQFNQQKPAPKRFDPFSKADNPKVNAWKESVARTNARLGLS